MNKRILALLLAFVMLFSLLPVTALATEAEEPAEAAEETLADPASPEETPEEPEESPEPSPEPTEEPDPGVEPSPAPTEEPDPGVEPDPSEPTGDPAEEPEPAEEDDPESEDETELEIASEPESGSCGANLSWALDELGTLTISGSGPMDNYSYDNSPPWYGKSIDNVVVEQGVTSIGTYAFYNTSIKSITISEGVTTIERSAFSYCTQLTSVTIPASATNIGAYAFYHCDNLNSAGTIGSTADIKFGWSEAIPDKAFQSCSELRSVVIPEGIKSIGAYAFSDCNYLWDLTLSTTLISIGDYAFSGCSNLKSVTLPEGLRTIGNYSFEDCSSLWDLTFATTLTSIGNYAFSDCSSLPNIDILSGITSIGSFAFENCTSVSRVTILDGLSTLGDNAFQGCTGIEEFYVSEGNTSFASLHGILYNKAITVLYQCPPKYSGEVVVPSGVTSIHYNAFSGCKDVTKVTIPASANTAPNWGKTAGPVGSGCDIEFNWTTRIPDGAFAGKAIESVILPNGLREIGARAFASCYALTGDMTLPAGVTTIGFDAFKGCGLSSITLTANVSSELGYVLSSENGGVFEDCSNLVAINVPTGNPYYTSIDGVLFSADLKTLYVFPGGKGGDYAVPSGTTTIHEYAFYNCTNVTSVSMPEGVTTISEYAFGCCYSLATVYLPFSLTYVGYMAFDEDELSDVYYNGTYEDFYFGNITFYEWNGLEYNYTADFHFLPSPENTDYSYKITFNKNAKAATGSMSAVSGKLSDGKSLPLNKFTCAGKSFACWNTRADGTGISYANGESIGNIIYEDNANITLYAQWVPATYTITYHGNGGDMTPPSQIKNHGESIYLSSETLYRLGYTFKGWATTEKNADAGKVNYKPGAVYKGNADLTLYAAWSPNVYTIIYDGNGVTKGASEAKMNITFGKAFTMKKGGFTKANYVLKGWSLTPHAAAVHYTYDYAVNQKMTGQDCKDFIAGKNYNSPIRLYAVWGPVEYKITYKYSPASAADYLNNPNAAHYNTIEGISFSSATSDGYDYVGIYSDAKCTKPISGYEPGVTGNKTVYLKFNPHHYTIKYKPNGGTATKTMDDLDCEVGKSYTLSKFVFTPPNGYLFSEWEYNDGADKIRLNNKQKVKDLSLTENDTVELLAIYTPISYTVKLNANGGKFPDGKTTKNLPAAKYDQKVKLPNADAMKAWSGYTLLGWNTKADCSGIDYEAGAEVQNLTSKNKGTVTLYAVWGYEITLNGNGGTLENGSATKTLNLKYKHAVSPDAKGFTKEGSTFRGWATSEANAKKGTVLKSLKNLTPGTTLYASWKPAFTNITVIFHSNNDANKVRTWSEKLDSTKKLPTIVEIGWDSQGRFKGWSTSAESESVEYLDASDMSKLTGLISNSKIHLYAIWGGKVVINANFEYPVNKALRITPHKSNAQGSRDPEAYLEVMFELDVENSYRYAQSSNGTTYCNIYAWDVTVAMECEIPHWTNNNGDICDPQAPGSWEIPVPYSWMKNHGSRFGWQQCTYNEAIARANNGYPTVVMDTSAEHIAMVAPQTTDSSTMYISQAGWKNLTYTTLSMGWPSNYTLEYFTHD